MRETGEEIKMKIMREKERDVETEKEGGNERDEERLEET